MQIKKGIYRHFKGGIYQVVGMTRHSETLEEMVLYRHFDEDPSKEYFGELWVRPAKMFSETVEKDGKKMKRFTFVKENDY